MADLPVIDAGSDPRARGLAHGRMMAKAIKDNLETYLSRFEAAGSNRQEVYDEAQGWETYIRELDPAYHAEMAAVAQGAGLSVVDVALLNARYEITYRLFGKEAAAGNAPEQEGCTSFGLMPEVTADNKPYIGQAWDWLAGIRGRTFIQRVHRSHEDATKPDYVGFMEAGIVGAKMGVNEAGIGLCVNGLVTNRDGANGRRKPFHMRCQQILDSWRYDQAIGAVTSSDRTCSTNFLIGHADAEIIDIEATPDHCAMAFPTEGLITHANHLEYEKRVSSEMERIGPHTLFRAQRLRRLLYAHSGRIDRTVIEQALGDHFSFPAAICRHPDPYLPEAKRVITVACILVDLRDRVLHATDGQICENGFQSFPLYPDGGPSRKSNTERQACTTAK